MRKKIKFLFSINSESCESICVYTHVTNESQMPLTKVQSQSEMLIDNKKSKSDEFEENNSLHL